MHDTGVGEEAATKWHLLSRVTRDHLSITVLMGDSIAEI